MSKLLHGLKNFFKEEKLSDRRLRIIEIQEEGGIFNEMKRKRKDDGNYIKINICIFVFVETSKSKYNTIVILNAINFYKNFFYKWLSIPIIFIS
jgi:hypothetical protein